MEKKQSNDFLNIQKVLKRSLFFSLFTILLIGVSPDISANSSIFEQSYTLNLSFKNERIDHVLDEIAKQSGIRIAYSNEQIPANTTVSVHMKTSKIEEALHAVLGNSYSFKQIDDYIAIAKKTGDEEQSKVARVSQQKGKKISGLVTDADGNPIIGGTVSVEGTTNGVIIDIDGRYTINASEGDKLIFRYIGYNQEERIVKKETTINVRMEASSVSLDDVVVIGYGQQKKSSVVASVNAITAKELSMPTRSLANNIAGQVAGIIAIQRSGEPGKDDAQFWIRGVSSFAGGTNPLILVDGVPRKMNDISVEEIESFSVLKDAAATAVYGAEGANGVILITSKRGMVQKASLDVRAEYSVAKPTRLPQFMDSYNFASLYNEAMWEDSNNPLTFTNPFSEEVLKKYQTGSDPDLYPNVNFLDLLQDNTQNQRITLNLRGGTEKVRYFVSGSFYNENGIFDSKAIDKYNANIGLTRYNIRSNIDIDVTKTTVLSADISGQYTDSSYPAAGTEQLFNNLLAFAPNLFPLRFSDGKFSEYKLYNGGTGNPYNMLNESGYQKNWSAFIQSKLTLNQKLDFITQGLSLKLIGSFDSNFNSSTKRTKTPTTYYMQLNSAGEKEYVQVNEGKPDLTSPADAGKGGAKQIYLEASLNYNRTFAELHDVTAMALYMQKEKQSLGNGLPYKKQSIVARGTYGFDNRYLAEASFGITGSENFAKGYRFGIFPAVGVAWYISNEAFMKGTQDIISKLKVRFSYGKTGNDNAQLNGSEFRFPYRGLLNTGGPTYNFGFNGGSGGGGTNSPGASIYENTFAAPLLHWEIEDKNNIGLDLGLFNGRVDMTIDFFKNYRHDILMARKTVSAVTGFQNYPLQNFGKMTNTGFDANLVLKQSIHDVNLTFRGNVTYAKNKITEYDEVNPRYEYQRITGQSIGTPKLYIAEGLYTDNDFDISTNPSDGSKNYSLKEGLPKPSLIVRPGDIKYADLNEDDIIDSYDQTYNHKFYGANPEWVYGFGLNAEYKGFYAGIFFQGVANASINMNNSIPFAGGLRSSVRKEGADHWSSRNPDNHDVMNPRLHPESFPHNGYTSTWWFRSANFIRLKNLEFGYQFDKKLIQKASFKNARIYVQGNNLAVWDHVKMWDPELGSNGGTNAYPINMTWTVGLELGF